MESQHNSVNREASGESSGRRSETRKRKLGCQHNTVNVKVSGKYSAVEYNEMRIRSGRWSVKKVYL